MEKTSPTGFSLFSKHNRSMLYRRKSEVILVYVILLAFIFAAIFLSDVFLKSRNIRNLLISCVGLLFVSYGQLLIIILGGVDLSVGSVISLVNVVMVKLVTDNPATWIYACLISLAIGLAVGLLNGLIVVMGNLQPIIATLATQTFLAGVALAILPEPSGTLPSDLCKFVTKGLNYVFPALLTIVVTALVWMMLNRSRTGRYIQAVGGNEQSAKSSGIPTGKVKIKAFVLCALLAALSGIFLSCYATSGSPLLGEAYAQKSINVAVVGGASLAGGKGSVIGCIAAALILGIISNLLNLRRINSYYQFVIQGIILIIALALSAIRSHK